MLMMHKTRSNFEWRIALAINSRVNHARAMEWTVYIIECDDDSLYTGITTDLQRRFAEHHDRPQGAKYFNGRNPIRVLFREDGHTRSSASRREAAIKKLSRAEKKQLIAKSPQA